MRTAIDRGALHRRRLLASMLSGVAILASGAARPAVDSSGTEARPTLTLDELRARYRDRAGLVTDIRGLEIYYKDEGSGPAILLVHGSASSLRTYDGVARKLRRHYRIIRYDVPGQGLSGPVSDAAAAALAPEDIAIGLLEKLGVSAVTAVGVSSGGTLGVYLAARRPDLVERLVLSNTPSDPVDTSHLQPSKDFEEAQREARETKFQSQHFWNLFLDYFSGEPERISPAVRRQYFDFNRRVADKNSLSLVAKVADHDKAVAAMSKVAVPTLLLWGARDPLLPPSAAHVLAGYLTHAEVSLLLMPDVGHYPPLEVPERFAAVLEAYIESVAPSPAPAPRP